MRLPHVISRHMLQVVVGLGPKHGQDHLAYGSLRVLIQIVARTGFNPREMQFEIGSDQTVAVTREQSIYDDHILTEG